MILLIGDLHLTDKTRDDYRFKIFDWIRKQQDSLPVAATFLAGDLTDAKDRHSATLVNKTVGGLLKLKPPVYIDRGNHDYRDPVNPFFKFLNHIEGLQFITEPTLITHQFKVGIIPHYREQAEFDAAVKKVSNSDAFLVHQTFEGAIAETGTLLSGLRASLIESLQPRLGVWAGDVHKPQRQGLVTYIGCPYHVRFGDGFNPRVLFINAKGKRENLFYDAPYKWSLTIRDADDILNNSNLAEDDQVKLTIELPREEMVEWKRIKSEVLDACKEKGVDVYGCSLTVKSSKATQQRLIKSASKEDVFDQFCKIENVAVNIRKAGQQLREDFDGDKTVL